MKVAHAETHVKGSHGITETKGFGIRTNAHAFKMLSSGLYSDKVTAVLREIGCNATDAHIEQGTPDLPIEVKLPNRIDKQFYVKDWGPGLSHDDVMNLYTTYFASTKQSSNDFTGAFGLGSKSPFSYTDAFVVTSAHAGKKRTYSAHLGDDGSPTIALLTTEDVGSDWPHGMSVGFPVKPGDYEEFQRKAQQVFRWFRVSPKIEGAPEVKKIEKSFDSPEFFRCIDEQNSGVLMGNVHYPLNASSINGLSKVGGYFFNFSGLVLKLNIGDVQVAASREELQYDKAGTALLSHRCDTAAMFIARDVERSALAFSNAQWKDKCTTAAMDSKWLGNDHRYFQWSELFKAAGMPDAEKIAKVIKARSIPLPVYAGAKTAFRVMAPENGKVRHYAVTDGTGPKDKWGNRQSVHLNLVPETKVYFGKASHALARARLSLLSGAIKQLVLIVPSSQKGGDEKDVAREAAKLLADFPGIDSADVATLPLPAGFAARGKRTKKGATLAPLPSKMVLGIDSKGKDVQIDIATSGLTYMVNARGYRVRVLDTTLDKDKLIYRSDWSRMIRDASALRDEIGAQPLPPHALVSAAEARALDLPKRGMPLTYNAIKAWLEDPLTRGLVAALAGKWRPTVVLGGYGSTWVMFLINLRESNRPLYDDLRPALLFPGLAQAVDDIHAASKKAGSRAGGKTVAAVDLFTSLQREFSLASASLAVGSRTYLDPDDLNAQLLKKYPLFKEFNPQDVNFHRHHPGKLRAFVEFLHT